jgi:hypothetical protein
MSSPLPTPIATQAASSIDLTVVFWWPVVVFVVGTALVAALRIGSKPVGAWLKRVRIDRKIKRALAADTFYSSHLDRVVTVGQVIAFQERYPEIKWPRSPFDGPANAGLLAAMNNPQFPRGK